MGKGILTIAFLIISNVFMTLAWYGHLKLEEMGWLKKNRHFHHYSPKLGIGFIRTYFSGSGK